MCCASIELMVCLAGVSIWCASLEIMVCLAGVVYLDCLNGDDGVPGFSCLCGLAP